MARDPDPTDLPTAGVTDAALGEARAAVQARRDIARSRIAEARELEEMALQGVRDGSIDLGEYRELRDDRISLEWSLGWRKDLPDRLVEALGVQPVLRMPGVEGRAPAVLPLREKRLRVELLQDGAWAVVEARLVDLRADEEGIAWRRRPPVRRWKQLPLPKIARWKPKRVRKCNPNPRAYTYNTDALRALIRKEKDITQLEVVAWQATRPRTRGDCKDMPRPCPFISCRHHMAIEVNEENGSLKALYPHLRIVEEPEGEGLQRLEDSVGTCSLDIVDRFDFSEGVGGIIHLRQVAESGHPIGQTNAMELEAVADVFGQSHENIREIGSDGLQHMRIAIRREDNSRVPRGLIQLRAPEPTGKSRQCPASGCNAEAEVLGVACRDHWRRVEREARLQLWRAWPLTIDQREAAREAVQMTREESGTMETKEHGAGAGPGDVGAQPTQEMPEEETHPPAAVDQRQMGLFSGAGPASGEGQSGS